MQFVKENAARNLKMEQEDDSYALFVISSKRLDGSWTTINRAESRSEADRLFKINGG